jgi:hypothetical protein
LGFFCSISLDLAYIASHFKMLISSITKLETVGLPLHDALEIIEDVKLKLGAAPGPVGKSVANKLEDVLRKNPGYNTIKNISAVFNHNIDNEQSNIKISDLGFGLNVSNIVNFNYIPSTSCDVERSFSSYKYIFSEKRQNLTVENIEMILVSHCGNK